MGVQNLIGGPFPSDTTSLKTVTSLNKEARLLKFHFPKRYIVFGDNETEMLQML